MPGSIETDLLDLAQLASKYKVHMHAAFANSATNDSHCTTVTTQSEVTVQYNQHNGNLTTGVMVVQPKLTAKKMVDDLA
jgi:hypothetical protein